MKRSSSDSDACIMRLSLIAATVCHILSWTLGFIPDAADLSLRAPLLLWLERDATLSLDLGPAVPAAAASAVSAAPAAAASAAQPAASAHASASAPGASGDAHDERASLAYLEARLQPVAGATTAIQNSNQARACIRDYFASRTCVRMVRPVGDNVQLQQLSSLARRGGGGGGRGDAELGGAVAAPGFVAAMASVRAALQASAAEQTRSRSLLASGAQVAAFLEAAVAAVNAERLVGGGLIEQVRRRSLDEARAHASFVVDAFFRNALAAAATSEAALQTAFDAMVAAAQSDAEEAAVASGRLFAAIDALSAAGELDKRRRALFDGNASKSRAACTDRVVNLKEQWGSQQQRLLRALMVEVHPSSNQFKPRLEQVARTQMPDLMGPSAATARADFVAWAATTASLLGDEQRRRDELATTERRRREQAEEQRRQQAEAARLQREEAERERVRKETEEKERQAREEQRRLAEIERQRVEDEARREAERVRVEQEEAKKRQAQEAHERFMAAQRAQQAELDRQLEAQRRQQQQEMMDMQDPVKRRKLEQERAFEHACNSGELDPSGVRWTRDKPGDQPINFFCWLFSRHDDDPSRNPNVIRMPRH
jgi:hypothetical protein